MSLEQVLLERKKNPQGEFFVNLFEWCNLSCSFCWQDHDDWSGIDSISQRAEEIVETLKKDPRTDFDINIMGGELFADEVPDQTFLDYEMLVQYIFFHTKLLGKNVQINWVSNLVFEKDRALKLVQRLQSQGYNTPIATSYDPRGRFTPKTRETFFKNFKVFSQSKLLKNISVVLTRPNIQAILKGDSGLSEIYENYSTPLFFDFYSPEKSHEINSPSDRELLDCLHYIYNKYPKSSPIKELVGQNFNYMTCRSSYIIGPRGFTGKCKSLVSKDLIESFKTQHKLEDNSRMEQEFVSKMQCSTCRHFDRCGLSCFLQHDFGARSELDECFMRLFYDSLENV